MTKKEALEHFDNNQAKLAKALGITRQYVGKWDDDEPIPELYELKLKYEILPAVKKEAVA